MDFRKFVSIDKHSLCLFSASLVPSTLRAAWQDLTQSLIMIQPILYSYSFHGPPEVRALGIRNQWQFAHPRPLSLLQRGLAPRSKGKARAELRPARRLQTSQEALLPLGHSMSSKRYLSRLLSDVPDESESESESEEVSFSILSFCLFILFMGFSRQEY